MNRKDIASMLLLELASLDMPYSYNDFYNVGSVSNKSIKKKTKNKQKRKIKKAKVKAKKKWKK